MNNYNELQFFLMNIMVSVVGYFVVVLILSVLFFVVLKKFSNRRKISSKKVTRGQILIEMINNIKAILIQTILYLYIFPVGYFKLTIDNHSIDYNIFSFIILVILHETYFYWTHRLLHTKWLFKNVHMVHHKSKTPNPWSAYSFSSIETVIQLTFLPIILLIVPYDINVITLFVGYIVIINIIGHSDVEFMPSWWLKTKYFGTTTYHTMHHHKSNGNYGLMLRFWDKIMKTEFKNYEEQFNKLTKKVDNN
jgi:lathosterol oxidase